MTEFERVMLGGEIVLWFAGLVFSLIVLTLGLLWCVSRFAKRPITSFSITGVIFMALFAFVLLPYFRQLLWQRAEMILETRYTVVSMHALRTNTECEVIAVHDEKSAVVIQEHPLNERGRKIDGVVRLIDNTAQHISKKCAFFVVVQEHDGDVRRVVELR